MTGDQPPATDAPVAILVVQVDIDPGREDEFNRWYDDEHVPEKRATPDSVRPAASGTSPSRTATWPSTRSTAASS
jgi:hypothetical protein